VFYKKDGRPFGDIKKGFLAVLARLGIINFTFHDLRHTFASHLVMNRVDLNTDRELLGYKRVRMTLRYSHLSPEHKKWAVEVLNNRWVVEEL
jgi:integrase